MARPPNNSRAIFFKRCAMAIESEVVWLRLVLQILREDAIVDRMRVKK